MDIVKYMNIIQLQVSLLIIYCKWGQVSETIFGSERSLRSADVVGLSVGQSALCSKALPKSSLGFLRVPKSS